jgi:hypothetical protein
MNRLARILALLVPLTLLTAACKGGTKVNREKGQARLETDLLDSLNDANRAMVFVTDPKDPQLDQAEAALAKCEAIERELQALGPLRPAAERSRRDTRALRLVVAAHRAGPGPESDRLRQQSTDLLRASGSPMPPEARQTENP